MNMEIIKPIITIDFNKLKEFNKYWTLTETIFFLKLIDLYKNSNNKDNHIYINKLQLCKDLKTGRKLLIKAIKYFEYLMFITKLYSINNKPVMYSFNVNFIADNIFEVFDILKHGKYVNDTLKYKQYKQNFLNAMKK